MPDLCRVYAIFRCVSAIWRVEIDEDCRLADVASIRSSSKKLSKSLAGFWCLFIISLAGAIDKVALTCIDARSRDLSGFLKVTSHGSPRTVTPVLGECPRRRHERRSRKSGRDATERSQQLSFLELSCDLGCGARWSLTKASRVQRLGCQCCGQGDVRLRRTLDARSARSLSVNRTQVASSSTSTIRHRMEGFVL
ncbi:hypothetical protein PLANPX_4866 [Lacipirellula parvula]|uniref:Uncharacterized protein n=1 Tax=Lacipirellula parvula TaxID=2650471 RepID=A0A5K7XEG4_9BACT|nr:hypothetical protein PLANPX_4866 [Lacipirellula parvula]